MTRILKIVPEQEDSGRPNYVMDRDKEGFLVEAHSAGGAVVTSRRAHHLGMALEILGNWMGDGDYKFVDPRVATSARIKKRKAGGRSV